MQKLLEVKEAAEILNIADATLYAWIHRGVAPPYVRLPSGSVRFRLESVEKWIAAAEQKPQRSRRPKESPKPKRETKTPPEREG